MAEYNKRLILGDSEFGLDETQKDYLRFEERFLRKKFSAYLESAKNEAEMQYFFEVNPAFLPGLYDFHNGPLGNVVISKLQLGNDFVTDFALISVNSAAAQITLIEIESPKTPIFRNSDDQFSSSFNKAYQQVRDWGLWAEQNATYLKDRFRQIYSRGIFRFRKVVVQRILVAGRRSEIQRTSLREKRWAGINHDPHISVMSYDRLNDMFMLNPRILNELICRPEGYISRVLKRH